MSQILFGKVLSIKKDKGQTLGAVIAQNREYLVQLKESALLGDYCILIVSGKPANKKIRVINLPKILL